MPACLAMQNQSDTINFQKTFMFICRQKINFTPMLFWRYCKNMQTSYFGYFGHAWLNTSRMIVSNCRRLLCLSACQKYTSSLTSFLRYYILKNPAFDWQIAFWLPITGEPEFCQMRDWWWNINKILVYILDYFQEKLTTRFFKKSKKPYTGAIWGLFLPKFGQKQLFLEKWSVTF